MLAPTRPQRQLLATFALVLTSVAPTALVGSTLWRLNRPEHVREVEEALSRRLNLRVSIDSVRHPRPGEDVLGGLVVRAEESGRPGAPAAERARAARVRVSRDGREWAVAAEGLRVGAEGPGEAVALLASLIGRVDGSAGVDAVGFSADSCVVAVAAGAGPACELRSLGGRVAPSGAGRVPTLSASYRVGGDGPSTRCEMTLRRTRDARGARTLVAIRTSDGLPLPARVLAPFFPPDDWLGPEAKVEGALTLSQSGADAWEAAFSGQILDLDLANLFRRQFPEHRLRGLARLRVEACRWGDLPGGHQGSGWVEAKGSLTAGPGAIGVGLLSSLASELRFRVPRNLDASPRPEVDFQGLGLRFALGPDGEIRLLGDLGVEYPPDAVLTRGDRTSPLASAPALTTDVRGLRKALIPVGSPDQLIPARPESEFLRHLPLPPTATAARGTPRR